MLTGIFGSAGTNAHAPLFVQEPFFTFAAASGQYAGSSSFGA
jgi:hypothetical protein